MAAALLLIDIQTGFDAPVRGARNNPGAAAQAARLLSHWRAAGSPVIHVRHASRAPGSPLGPGTGGTAFRHEVAPLPGETVLEKSVKSAFIGSGLEAHLRAREAADAVICGLTTPHCVPSTVRMAANLGLRVRLAHDACAAFAGSADTSWRPGLAHPDPQAIHEAAVSPLHGEFARAVVAADLPGGAP